jgi:hypothetical protein
MLEVALVEGTRIGDASSIMMFVLLVCIATRLSIQVAVIFSSASSKDDTTDEKRSKALGASTPVKVDAESRIRTSLF